MSKLADNLAARACGRLPFGARAGFTLMELLVVIAIMAIISTVAVGGYFGLTRAASYNAAHDAIFNTLALTRQRAVIDGKVTSFMVLSPTNYVVVRAMGRISHASTDNAFDAFGDLAGALSPGAKKIAIYNLDSDAAAMGKSRLVTVAGTTITMQDPTADAGAAYNVRFYNVAGYAFNGADDKFFKDGDRYGFALHSEQSLPRGYLFASGSKEVRFGNDGSCPGEATVTVIEKIKPDNFIEFHMKKSGEIEDNSKVKK